MSTEPSTKSSSLAKLNIRALEEAWRKERRQQEEDHMKEVRPLRGGDWIASRGALMTLGVTWINECDNKKYGLTGSHGFVDHGLGVGDSAFAFDSDDESAIISMEREPINRSKLAPSYPSTTKKLILSSLRYSLTLSSILLPCHCLEVTTTSTKSHSRNLSLRPIVIILLCRRFLATNMIGTSDGGGSKPNNKNDDVTATEVLVEGRGDAVEICDATTNHYVLRQQPQFDCGALYLDEDGIAWCMHTMRNVWTSQGTFLQNIVDRHPIYFGHPEPIADSVSNASSQMRLQSSKVNLAWEKIVLPLTYGAYPRMKYPHLSKDFFCIRQPALPISRIFRMRKLMAMNLARKETKRSVIVERK